MSLDIPTLFVIAVFVGAVAGFLLLLSWLQNRNVRALALWASSLIIGSIGVALIGARGDISDTWSIARRCRRRCAASSRASCCRDRPAR
jgi:hypothetical protein